MQSTPDSQVFSSAVSRKPAGTQEPKGHGGQITLLLLFAVLAGGFYATPYISVMRMRAAIEKRDTDAIAKYVDFPALRENLKEQIYNAALADTAVSGEEAASNLFGAGLAEGAIDMFITPEGLEAILCGKMLAPGEEAMTPQEQSSTQRLFEMGEQSAEMRAIMNRYKAKPSVEEKKAQQPDTAMKSAMENIQSRQGWKGISTFAVFIRNKTDNAEFTLLFHRTWLLWKLTSVKLPEGESPR